MAVPYLTSASLIASVKRRAAIPINQNTFTNDDILAFANEELMIGLIPSVLQVHEEFFVYTEEVTLVPNQRNYAIPSRAIGNKLRQISYKDNNGNLYEMTRIQPEIQYDVQRAAATTAVYRFYVQGNEIFLAPPTTATVVGSLLFSFYIRPNMLVDESRAGVITDINTTTGVVTVSSFPSVFAASNQYDFIQTKSPHKILSYDKTPVTVNSVTKTLTFAPADLPSSLAIGDSVMLAGETIIPNVPTDLHMMLAHRVATRCLEAIGDTQGLANANQKLAEMEMKSAQLIDNRVEGSPQKIVNKGNILRMGKIARRRTWL
jgi:hypothetical protein